jgi:hypothetical protein
LDSREGLISSLPDVTGIQKYIYLRSSPTAAAAIMFAGLPLKERRWMSLFFA